MENNKRYFVNGIGQAISVPVLSNNDAIRIAYLRSLSLTEENKKDVFKILPHLDRLDLAYWAQTLDKEHLLFLYEQPDWRNACKAVYNKSLLQTILDTIKMYRLGGYWNADYLKFKLKQGLQKCLPF